MDDRLDHLQHNLASLILHTLTRKKEKGSAEGLLQAILTHDGLQEALHKLLGKLADQAATGLDKWVDDWLHKK